MLDIQNTLSGVILYGSNDSDSILNGGDNVTVYAEAGNDNIENYSGIKDGLIYGGDGNDMIDVANQTAAFTVSGGHGNDTIDAARSTRNLYLYADGDGNDVIYNFNYYHSNDTLQITSGTAETVTVGSDIVVKVGEGSILLKGNAAQTINNDTAGAIFTGTEYGDFMNNTSTGENVSIVGLTGDDTVCNYANNVTVSVGDEDDVIWNENGSSNVLIDGGGGNDSINNWGNYTTIYGGDGSDTIFTYDCQNPLIYGGAGDDSIKPLTSGATVYGGTGNDTIGTIYKDSDGNINYGGISEGFVYVYNYGDGNDTITAIQDDSTLIIGGDYTRTTEGNNVIIRVGDGSITLLEAANVAFTINTVESSSAAVTKSANVYTWNGGSGLIDNYTMGEQINLAGDFTGIGTDENNFYVNSSAGTLTIQNARNKIISYGDAAGNLLAYSYMAEFGGDLDGSSFAQYEVIIGANNSSNKIIAGSGGSSLWGGSGGNDTLIGGAGYDEFCYSLGSGSDVIQNAASNDIVNLSGLSLENIINLDVNESAVSASFSDGGNLRIEGNTGVGYKLGGAVYTVNQTTKEWFVK